MLQLSYKKHVLQFKRPAGTSRGVLTQKTSYYLLVRDTENPEITGIGECSTIKGLSPDPWNRYEETLDAVCHGPEPPEYWLQAGLEDFPSIRFGLETALLDRQKGGRRILFPSEFTQGRKGITINGLIWMGDAGFMKQQIRKKLDAGFRCVKLKIGAIDFEKELELLKMIRLEHDEKELELRVDANGAFAPDEALEKLKRLSDFALHSIEQPIRQGQWEMMARLCETSPVPVALDEELIGLKTTEEMQKMMQTVRPQYLVLKPSLLGGFAKSRQWIAMAEQSGTGWWVTSALEGNIGLNAIAQWTFLLENPLPQGLGTGQLFTNNISSPLFIEGDQLKFAPENRWDLDFLEP
ncbi:o-succinylbenzoate synthase [Candidatus Sulfidibacterium hydrothermale]|uniref:o-succinylbenzoate synthase n=1 Tax=Candidatus Sulfidibacterium hydrothermale TaxID=2875962 RepID=UPI001F0B0A66|nr:o-succinylbenzoate synthase [Candidatus Sulfidibacterium hydrothermale]UBM63127.1 o-succinylbenzoate synthase [Candidatus Sulfidibacterium hydrothermale]